MRPAPHSFLSRGLPPLLVALCAVLLWTGYSDRWTPGAWAAPDDYSGDPCEIYTRVRLALEAPLQPFLGYTAAARLAAPFGADWSAYPVSDAPVFALAGLLARVVGPVAAVNLLGCGLLAAAAVSFHLCARHLRWRPEWAACGALLFAFSNYHLRWFVTLSFTQTWTLPPLLLLCASAARAAPPVGRDRARTLWGAAALGLWLGWGNPYFVFFAGCVLAGTFALHRLRRAPWRRLAPLAVLAAAMATMVLLSHWSFLAAKLAGGDTAEQFDRNFAGAEIYALKPLDLAMPPPEHRSRVLRELGGDYASGTAIKGELFYNYLGLVGLAGLALLAAVALRRAAQPVPNQRIPDAALGALWAGLLSTVGGGTALIALGGITWFRASNRISVLFSLWALLFLFGALHRASCARPRWLTLALAAALGTAGWFEQTPRFPFATIRATSAAKLAADRATAATLEQTLAARAAVFQLPFAAFPEAGTIHRMGDYEHFRPFLATHTLRFSYGGLLGQPATKWAALTARLPAAEMIEHLQAAGFAALWIDRRGYADNAESLLAQLHALGLVEIPTARAPEIVVLRLVPRVPAQLPDLADVRLLPPWDPVAPAPPAGAPHLIDLGGWYPAERAPGRTWRWARRSATLGLHWAGPPTAGELRFTANATAHARLTITVDGRALPPIELRGGRDHEYRVPCPLRPGLQRLVFEYDGRLRRPGQDSRQLGFVLANPTWGSP